MTLLYILQHIVLLTDYKNFVTALCVLNADKTKMYAGSELWSQIKFESTFKYIGFFFTDDHWTTFL